MQYNEKLSAAMEASEMTPEEFGALLAAATNPVSFNETHDRLRHTARVSLLGLPYGDEILKKEDRL